MMYYVFTNFGALLIATNDKAYAESTAEDIGGVVLDEEEMEAMF